MFVSLLSTGYDTSSTQRRRGTQRKTQRGIAPETVVTSIISHHDAALDSSLVYRRGGCLPGDWRRAVPRRRRTRSAICWAAAGAPSTRRLTPQPAGSLTGRVLAGGQPVAGATVVVAERTGAPHAGQTDAAGRYRIAGIPPGQYVPAAVARGLRGIDLDGLPGHPRAGHPRAGRRDRGARPGTPPQDPRGPAGEPRGGGEPPHDAQLHGDLALPRGRGGPGAGIRLRPRRADGRHAAPLSAACRRAGASAFRWSSSSIRRRWRTGRR